MHRKQKLLLPMISLLLLPLLFCRPAAASEPISYVRLELSYSPAVSGFDLGTVSMDSFQKEYDFSFRIEAEAGAYLSGDPLPITATLTAFDGFSFTDIKKASCKLNDTAASSIEISDAGKVLRCSFILPALCMILPAPENLYLSKDGSAGWDPVPGADFYTVNIQFINDMGGRSLIKTEKIRTVKADLSDIMFNQPNDYVFSVSAGSDRYWILESEEAPLPVSDSVLVTWEDIGYTESVVWDDGFIHPDMTEEIASDIILKIKGKSYCLDERGFLRTGWIRDQGNWYYFDPADSKMVHGLFEIDGKKYYFDPETGIMQTGFSDVGGAEMFFSEDGHAITGWVRLADRIYYVTPSGSRNYSRLIDRNGRSYIFDPEDGHLILPG